MNSRLLEKLNVLEIGNGIAGSQIGKLFTDVGAGVTKFAAPPGAHDAQIETAFRIWDFGKTIVDRPSPDRLADLLARTDVVIDQNWTPEHADAAQYLNLTPQSFLGAKAGAIYCTIDSGLPFTLPSGFDPLDLEALVCARAGLFFGQPGVAAAPSFVDIAVASTATALRGFLILSAALLDEESAPHGRHVELDLCTTPVYVKGGILEMPAGLEQARREAYNIPLHYRASDGRWLIVVVPSARLCERLVRTLEQLELPIEGLDCMRDGLANLSDEQRAKAAEALTSIFGSAPASYWEETLGALDIPSHICREPVEWLNNPHALTAGIVRDYEMGSDSVRGVGSVFKVESRRGA